MCIFGVTTAYMIGAAVFCVYKAVELSADSLIMAQIVISLVSTCPFVFAIPPDAVLTDLCCP